MTPIPTPDPPLLSVIVPARNCPQQLRECLLSLRASRREECEVIVVDDASTDATPAVAAEFGAGCVRMESRSGPAAARNRGAEVARGCYLLFVDADVCVSPDTVGDIVAVFEGDPTVDAVFGS